MTFILLLLKGKIKIDSCYDAIYQYGIQLLARMDMDTLLEIEFDAEKVRYIGVEREIREGEIFVHHALGFSSDYGECVLRIPVAWVFRVNPEPPAVVFADSVEYAGSMNGSHWFRMSDSSELPIKCDYIRKIFEVGKISR